MISKQNVTKALFLLALMGLISGCGFEIVDTGYRGVQTRFGEVVSGSLKEGLYFYNPLTSTIVELDVREQKWTSKTEASTKDVQAVDVEFTVNYRPDATQVHELYRTVGYDWDKRLLPQIVVGELKNAISLYNAVNLIEHRAEVVRAASRGITDGAFTRKIEVTRFEIVDFQFTKEFSHAVEAKVTAEQQAAKAKNDTVRIQEEARQQVITAQASAESIRIRTEALAKSPALIQWEAVQKWDGKLPNYMLGESAVPLLNLGNKP